MSELLTTLKFVQGAVAKKEIIETLTHFCIENGTIRSFNGNLALCSPIDIDLNCKPKAVPFVKAIQNCDETVTLSMTPAGKLRVKAGKFRALIECVEKEGAHPEPEGEMFDIDGEQLLVALRTLEPIIGTDAARPWTNGIRLSGNYAQVTNNITIVQYWMENFFPLHCVVHKEAIKEILRVKEVPIKAQATANSITFHFESGRWIRTNLLVDKWPDINKILDTPSNPVPMNEEIFTAIEVVKPFTDKLGKVYFEDGLVKTTLDDEDEGAVYAVNNLPKEGIYQIAMIELLKGLATTIDWTDCSKPCYFFGENLRGAMIGLKR